MQSTPTKFYLLIIAQFRNKAYQLLEKSWSKVHDDQAMRELKARSGSYFTCE